jgi:hypothetical protein
MDTDVQRDGREGAQAGLPDLAEDSSREATDGLQLPQCPPTPNAVDLRHRDAEMQ